ncbi:alpha-glucan phosphorylase [Snodgrassella sp. ESL0253]|uniref:alpha-glucan phosphorylase n=1 Tax=Snodgrassella sp. ESL0253 TaxID=2705031 RepID=UPI0015828FE2|nr:alpha-glucan phosphorylase [Snodgrassella sp. ESL0253]NUE66111.1 alpha-glucan phosphorylase [Snodgrassella sp. ESL0253]
MMNNSIPKVKTAYVLLVNVDDRQTAMLRMAFKMYNSVNYQLIQPEDNVQPELILVDGDAADGEAVWQKVKKKYPDAVVVFFGRNSPSFTAPYLMKPIRFDTLFQHLRNLQQGNGVWLADNKAAAQKETATEQSVASTAQQEHNAVDHSQQAVTVVRFHTNGTLLGMVQKLAQQTEDTAILFENKPVLIVFPSVEKVLLAVESDTLQQLCMQTDVEWQTKAVPASAPTAQLHDKAKLTLQACIWQLSIWTARGRLIDPITPDTIIKLKAWPNMTRMAYLPESMRLSAFLVRTPVALNTLYKLLPVSLEDVLNYIAATYSIGSLIIEQPLTHSATQQEEGMTLTRKAPQAVTKPAAGVQTTEHNESDENKPKGLLARLMGRLRGN